ncbi:chromosome partition protein Smc [Kordiimonas sediminis]|uniref:Chromosome partition protein Smc n=1 Tax=Kordiimonas sediminis TaxID=1735581 RepID=A0A919AUY4_9PROT|nr:AAA family ATPase [Kordiimonas sediminis]GHF24825.1 chromosome partition protein Smc [Kordiimonas sediminis]
MHFSRLRLSGFKSFVDPTELLIEPGLTGVVGPNGCGKSNLLEAIRWVMGENRAKSLRGSGMDDVIFAGTDKRPPRNLAEVTLVLDNFERNAPSGYNAEDMIEVTRRIERESGSAYRINGLDVRQKDVQLLFADAATGAHSPALVSQGRIGALINAKPADRRAILEEAAGISGLHSRRKEAESRLRGAEGNLVRLQDVIQGMETQIASLKRQAKQAVRYKTISTDIRQAEAGLLYQRWKMSADEVIELERLLRSAESEVGTATKAVSILSREREEMAALLPALRDTDAEMAARLQRLNHERENLDAEEKRREETAITLRTTIDQIGADREREEEIAKDAKAALDRLATEKTRLQGAQGAETEAKNKAQIALEAASRKANEAEQAYDTLSEQGAQARARKSSLESDRLAVNRRMEQIEAEEARLIRESEQLAASNEAFAAVKDAEKAATELEEQLEKATVAVTAAEAATSDARIARNDADAVRSEKLASVKALEGEERSLTRLLERNDQDGAQPVADLIKAKPGYEIAIGAALGEEAEAGISAEASRFWQDVPSGGVCSWGAGTTPMSEYVDVPDVLKRRITLTGLIDASDEDAEKIGNALIASLEPGQMLVSRSGAVWRWDGFTVRAGAPSSAAMRLEHRNRLEDIRQQLTKAQEQATHAEEAVEAARAVHETAREAEQAQRQLRKDAERALVDIRRDLVAAEQEASRRASRLNSLKEAQTRVAADKAETSKRLDALDAQLKELPDVSGLEAELQQARANVETLRSELSTARAAFESLRREAEARSDRLMAISSEATAWETRVNSATKQLDALKEREEDAKKQLEAVIAGPADIAEKREALLTSLNDAEKHRQAAADKLVEAEAALAAKDQFLKDAQEAMANVREQQIRVEASVETALNRRKDIAAQIGERFECAPTKVLEKVGLETSESLPDVSVLEGKLEKFKRERDRLGAVNLRADEELVEIDEQLTHLVKERTDLEEAIARLRKAINSLNREGRERLLAAFEVVNSHFGELFSTLFGGGEAHLELTESDDPLDAGLEIFASPPGKKLQALSLLSGGEQALTALSLIFAVFITNPAPICVLDEVDAPLDDANVERFCNLLDNMIERTNTRFLIVTHNAVSMSRMNRLFGVTMAERGVSTLVSVDLERAETLVEAG